MLSGSQRWAKDVTKAARRALLESEEFVYYPSEFETTEIQTMGEEWPVFVVSQYKTNADRERILVGVRTYGPIDND